MVTGAEQHCRDRYVKFLCKRTVRCTNCESQTARGRKLPGLNGRALDAQPLSQPARIRTNQSLRRKSPASGGGRRKPGLGSRQGLGLTPEWSAALRRSDPKIDPRIAARCRRHGHASKREFLQRRASAGASPLQSESRARFSLASSEPSSHLASIAHDARLVLRPVLENASPDTEARASRPLLQQAPR